jgi:hypothetical protein
MSKKSVFKEEFYEQVLGRKRLRNVVCEEDATYELNIYLKCVMKTMTDRMEYWRVRL